jgi:hypothetical protein
LKRRITMSLTNTKRFIRTAASLCLLVSTFTLSRQLSAQVTPVSYNTGIQVQNLENSLATVVFTFYPIAGSPINAGDTIGSLSSKTYFPLSSLGVGSGFAGSAVVSSDRNIRAVVNQLGSLAGTTYLATTNGFLQGHTQVNLPLIMCQNNNYNTWFSVQNAGSANADFYVTYYGGGAPVATDVSNNVAPGAARVFDQTPGSTTKHCGTGGGLPAAPFVGSAIVTSTQPIVVAVMQLNTVSFRTLLGYNGFTSDSTTVALPLVMANNSGFFTGIQVQNADTVPVAVTITYGPDTVAPPFSPNAESFTLNPGSSKTVLQSGTSPANGSVNNWTVSNAGTYVGSAVITATGRIVAIVNQLRTTSTPVATAYEGFDPAQATTQASAPLIMANNSGYFTGIQVQNADTVPVAVTITYGPDTVAPPFSPNAESFTLNPGSSKTVLQSGTSPANGSVNNWSVSNAGTYVGSAVITATGKIVAIVNQLRAGVLTGGDTFATGQAFNY